MRHGVAGRPPQTGGAAPPWGSAYGRATPDLRPNPTAAPILIVADIHLDCRRTMTRPPTADLPNGVRFLAMPSSPPPCSTDCCIMPLSYRSKGPATGCASTWTCWRRRAPQATAPSLKQLLAAAAGRPRPPPLPPGLRNAIVFRYVTENTPCQEAVSQRGNRPSAMPSARRSIAPGATPPSRSPASATAGQPTAVPDLSAGMTRSPTPRPAGRICRLV